MVLASSYGQTILQPVSTSGADGGEVDPEVETGNQPGFELYNLNASEFRTLQGVQECPRAVRPLERRLKREA